MYYWLDLIYKLQSRNNMRLHYHMRKDISIISHIRNNGGRWEIQTNEEHQERVAKLSSKFASSFGMAEFGRVLGLLHDKGKEKQSFQQHIKKMSGYQPDICVEGDSSHAYVGALVANKIFPKQQSQLIDNIIMGHHRGLYDDDEKRTILEKTIPHDVKITPITAYLQVPNLEYEKEDIHHIVRMLFSCLVDADRLDTENFMLPEQSKLRCGKSTIDELLLKLEDYISDLSSKAKPTEVNKIRKEVQEYCKKESDGDVDFYSLTVPTGGGKTLSSVLWALRHAKHNNLNRIIIAIPYTSIITQTASVLRNIFGDENVLEHHSNVNVEDNDDALTDKIKLATENWDCPIIVTTNVQLFESLFSNKPSKCRKLHNMVKSVLILDEVQTLPTQFLKPIVDTLSSLKRIFSTSILFTTASQPVLEGEVQGRTGKFDALPKIKEIIPSNANLHQRLRRVNLSFYKESETYDEIANRLIKHDRVLCIVNTRRDALEIFERMPKEGVTLHLSRMMCPKHINNTIEIIHSALNSNQSIVRVISTQLIEAGVDIDFPVVYRQEAGLDSVLQAAGRCNREGTLDIATTYVFKIQGRTLPPGMISQANNARLNMKGVQDWFSTEAMHEYFKQLYSRVENFDVVDIDHLLYNPKFLFEEAAKRFKLIDDSTISVIVNYEESMKLVELLSVNDYSNNLIKKISQYSVNIRKHDFDKLCKEGLITTINDDFFVMESPLQYDEYVGVKTENQIINETFIV